MMETVNETDPLVDKCIPRYVAGIETGFGSEDMETVMQYVDIEAYTPVYDTQWEDFDVHPDLLERAPIIRSVSWLCVVLGCGVMVTAIDKFLLFGLSLYFLPFGLALIYVLRKVAKQAATKGERVFGRIIWTQDDTTRILPGYVVQYVVDDVTYQKKILDGSFGFMATEKYIELIVDKAAPKDPVLAIAVEHFKDRRRDCTENLTMIAVILLAMPFLVLPFDYARTPSQSNPSDVLFAILLYLGITGLCFLNQLLTRHKKAIFEAHFRAVALKKVTKPYTPGPEDRVSYHSILFPPRRFRYVCSSCFFMIAFIFHFLTAGGLLPLLALVPALAVNMMFTIVDYICLKPLRDKFKNEGVPPKNLSLIKSAGDGKIHIISIITYEMDVTDSNGVMKTVTALARVTNVQWHKILTLPSFPKSAFVPTSPIMSNHQRIGLLLSPIIVISFYPWQIQNADIVDVSIFAIISSTLLVTSMTFMALARITNAYESAFGMFGCVIILEQQK